MRLTIGNKLGLAFGAVILLSLVGALLTYVTVNDLVNVAIPTRERCDELTEEIKRSVDHVSGYVVVGGDTFRNDRAKAWERIDAARDALDMNLIASNADNADRKNLEQIKSRLNKLKSSQEEIEGIADNGGWPRLSTR